jgi:hypothetical protein
MARRSSSARATTNKRPSLQLAYPSHTRSAASAGLNRMAKAFGEIEALARLALD